MRNYPPEFKADAVALVLSRPDRTITSTARDLGVSRETLRMWERRRRRLDIRPAGDGSRVRLIAALEADITGVPARRRWPPRSGTPLQSWHGSADRGGSGAARREHAAVTRS
ncbi:transposase [Nonomuraea sp. MG754425]|uniref:transposase n=1 Tax=Nonomuraea sp. MG754425 TaxID=2570319 RepID=UPI0023515067|nr:transposase [Nonomuraea sp. MG754425]